MMRMPPGMSHTKTFTTLLVSTLSLTACATDDGDKPSTDRRDAIEALQHKTGAPVSFEVNELGTTRVLDMTPGFPVQARNGDAAVVAASFVADHYAAFQLDASDAASFVATNVDPEPKLGVSHVTLQRMYNDIPVFQGGIQLLMDSG